MTDAERLDALDTRIAYQDAIIEDLNKTVVAQWKEIERLTREFAMLADRLARAEEGVSGDPADEPPPPHY